MNSSDALISIIAPIALIAVAVTILLTMRSRDKALAILVGASGGLFAAQIFQVHVFTFAVVLWAVLAPGQGRRVAPWQAIVIVGSAALVSITAFTGDLVNSPTLGLQLLGLAVSAALVAARARKQDITYMLMGLLAIVSFSSLWGILQVANLVPKNVWHLQISALGRPTGIYPEPDWLGMFAGVGLVLAWRMQLTRWLRIALVTINGFALVLAFARAAWVAVAASFVIAAVASLARHRKSRVREVQSGRRAALAIFLIGGVIALFVIPSLASDLSTRLSRTLTVADGDVSAQARVAQNDGLLFLARTAPWYGHGVSASGRVGVSGKLEYGISANNVGSNWIVSDWVDGAFLALPLIALFLVAAALAARSIHGQVLVLVLVNSFISNATYQPILWLVLGCCMAQLRMSRDDISTLEPSDQLREKLPLLG